MSVKQVIVVRTHYPDGKGGTKKVRWGKLMAQCAHASMKVFFDAGTLYPGDGGGWYKGSWREQDPKLYIPLTMDMQEWVEGLFTKIVLTVSSEEDLLRVYELAQAAELPTALITDAGKTEFKKVCPDCAKPIGRTGMIARDHRVCETCKSTGFVGVPTHTTVAIGPAKAEDIDKITGKDGLVKTQLP